MNKMDKDIMVVQRERLLTPDRNFEGFQPAGYYDFVYHINMFHQWRRRGDMEEDSYFKQPIVYSALVNLGAGKVFAYQRGKKDKDYTEKRLQGKWAWGLGGHVDWDTDGQHPEGRALYASCKRELAEEVVIHGSHGEPRILGYLNFEKDVHAVHFGILCVTDVDTMDVTPKDTEILQSRFCSIPELQEMVASPAYEVELWSRTALSPLKQYIESTTLLR